MRLEGWHIVIIVVLAILLFGAPKLPGLARSVGQSLRIFKSEVRQLKDEDAPAGKPAAQTDPVTGAPIPPVPPAPVPGTPVSGAPVPGTPVPGTPVSGAPAPVPGVPGASVPPVPPQREI